MSSSDRFGKHTTYFGWTKSCTTYEAMGNHGWLVFTGESTFQGFLGGAGFRPSTICLSKWKTGVRILSIHPLSNWQIGLVPRRDRPAGLRKHRTSRGLGLGKVTSFFLGATDIPLIPPNNLSDRFMRPINPFAEACVHG